LTGKKKKPNRKQEDPPPHPEEEQKDGENHRPERERSSLVAPETDNMLTNISNVLRTCAQRNVCGLACVLGPCVEISRLLLYKSRFVSRLC